MDGRAAPASSTHVVSAVFTNSIVTPGSTRLFQDSAVHFDRSDLNQIGFGTGSGIRTHSATVSHDGSACRRFHDAGGYGSRLLKSTSTRTGRPICGNARCAQFVRSQILHPAPIGTGDTCSSRRRPRE